MTTQTERISTALSAEDLAMWASDQPRQRTTMAMLMLLDRRPDPQRLRAAVERALDAIPRMRQRVVEAPAKLALPRWEDDPTFDLDYHQRRYAQADPEPGEEGLSALFRAVGPIYERPFDRTRPLWEMIEIDRPAGGEAAVFFRLHHAMADGVGGNAILAALTDAECDGPPLPPPVHKTPGGWPEDDLTRRVFDALRHRAEEAADRARTASIAALQAFRHPLTSTSSVLQVATQLTSDALFHSGTPLSGYGRSRHLAGVDLDFEVLRRAKRKLGGKMIDLLLTVVAGAIGRWHRLHGHDRVTELAALVPINLRPPEELGLAAVVGNRTTGIMVRLPIAIADPLERFQEIHRRVEARKRHPSAELVPTAAELAAGMPRWLFKRFAVQAAASVDLIVTNVPGIPTARYLAGAEVTAGYPIAPTAPHTPVSIALYGYRGRLFIGLDADGTAMTDLDEFKTMLIAAFRELREAVDGRV